MNAIFHPIPKFCMEIVIAKNIQRAVMLIILQKYGCVRLLVALIGVCTAQKRLMCEMPHGNLCHDLAVKIATSNINREITM